MNPQPTKEYMIFQRRHPEDLDRGERTTLAAHAAQPLFSGFIKVFSQVWRVLVRIFGFVPQQAVDQPERAEQETLTTERMLRTH